MEEVAGIGITRGGLYVMDAIIELTKQDMSSFIIAAFFIMSGIIAGITIIGKFSEIIGKPVKWLKDKAEDHNLLIATVNSLNDLRQKHEESVKQSVEHDRMIREDLDSIKKLFINKEIDDWRWEILDMASAISSGRRYSKEQFDHVLGTHAKYEKILEEYNLTNGQVEASMDVINEVYKEKLKTGF